MIKHLTIQNYKSVQDLNIELGQFNVFIGENGCGKTNILEGIAIGSAAISNKLDDEFLAARGVRVTEKELMKSAFEYNKSQEIKLSIFDLEQLGYEIQLISNNDSFFFDCINRLKKGEETIFKFGTRRSIPHDIHFDNKKLDEELKEISIFLDGISPFLNRFEDNNHLQNFLCFCPENYFLRRFEEEIQIKPLGIRGQGLFKHIKDLYKHKPETLAKIQEKLTLISWFEGFEIPTDLMFSERRINIKDRYLAPELQFFDQRSSNEGFLYLLFYFTLFISEFTPKFFAIDNIDNALNPKLCSKLIEVLSGIVKENQKQVILTTHNPAILDGLDLTDDTQRLFVIYRNVDGHTKAKRVMPQKTVQGVEPVRLSEAFLRGYIGGLPKNF